MIFPIKSPAEPTKGISGVVISLGGSPGRIPVGETTDILPACN